MSPFLWLSIIQADLFRRQLQNCPRLKLSKPPSKSCACISRCPASVTCFLDLISVEFPKRIQTCSELSFEYLSRTCEICREPVKNLPSILPPSLKPKKAADSIRTPPRPAEERVHSQQDTLGERLLRCFVELCSPDEEQSKCRRARNIVPPARVMRA